jgi:hypothetical protein
VAERWKQRFPQWIVGLVRSDLVWFGDGDFSRAMWPLTAREWKLADAKATPD